MYKRFIVELLFLDSQIRQDVVVRLFTDYCFFYEVKFHPCQVCQSSEQLRTRQGINTRRKYRWKTVKGGKANLPCQHSYSCVFHLKQCLIHGYTEVTENVFLFIFTPYMFILRLLWWHHEHTVQQCSLPGGWRPVLLWDSWATRPAVKCPGTGWAPRYALYWKDL